MPSFIELTRGQRAIVDEVDFAALSRSKWHAHFTPKTATWRALRHVPLAGNKTEEMSATLLGVREGFVIDHRNRNALDYRRENLRWATVQQNCRNRRRPNALAPGVFKSGKGFSARITITKGVRKFLGYFKTVQEGASAYQTATKTYFGEFSPFNN